MTITHGRVEISAQLIVEKIMAWYKYFVFLTYDFLDMAVNNLNKEEIFRKG